MSFRLEKKEPVVAETVTSDSPIRPSHYRQAGTKRECIDEMLALFGYDAVIGFCKCNIYKYRYRANAKGGQEDLDKANQYMDFLVRLENQKYTEGVYRF